MRAFRSSKFLCDCKLPELLRSDADERVNVEVVIGLGWILRELAGGRQAAAAKSVEVMDVNEPEKAKIQKTGTIAPRSTV